MTGTDYESCYAALQLNFGAGLKEVNASWRKLSRIHHPDRHMRDPHAYRQALEKQKQLNNARGHLKQWFNSNPNSPPPRTQRNSTQNKTQNGSGSSQSTQGGQAGSKSHSTQGRSQQSSGQSNNSYQHQSHSQHHWQQAWQTHSGTSSARSESPSGDSTSWFKSTELTLTLLQEWVKKIDAFCKRPNSDSATAVAMALCFAAVFGPLWLITAILGAIFPDLPGHYPEWSTPFLLFGSGYVTTYLFRWYFAEVEIIKLQEQTRFFTTDRTVQNSIEFLKLAIGKQIKPGAQWKFQSNGGAQEAILEFEEQLLPELKRSRKLVLRFDVKDCAAGRLVGLEVRTTSPINSFACRKIAEAVVVELKKDFREVAA